MRNEALSIGQVARQAGVNVQTLRYYERRDLLQPPQRSEAGRRQYPLETVRLIRFVKRAQDLGFTLKEIEDLIALRETRGSDRSLVRRLASTKPATSMKRSVGCEPSGERWPLLSNRASAGTKRSRFQSSRHSTTSAPRVKGSALRGRKEVKDEEAHHRSLHRRVSVL